MSKKDNSGQEDRRSREDRRKINRAIKFPLRTLEGLVVLKDRRKTPDRRVNNISVEESDIDEDEFLKMFDQRK